MRKKENTNEPYDIWRTAHGFWKREESQEPFDYEAFCRYMDPEKEEPYWAWLCSIPGLYLVHHQRLLEYFHSPEDIWLAPERELEFLQMQGAPWASKVSEFRSRISPEENMHILTEKRIHFTSICSPEYPRRLKTIPDAPLGLFYRGELPPEQKGIIAIVGARMCSPYGKAMAELIARTTSQCGGIVVSGGAYGIDGVAQMEVVRCQGKSYSVLGCGADKQYPSTNSRLFHELERCGGILSEYPAGTEPRKYHFPMRNRIISGLADAVVVVEAKKQSGSLITADFALSQGREVIAVPGRPDDELSSGCNELIAQGAGIFRSPEQFIEEVLEPAGLQKIEKTTELALAPSEKLVYSSLGLHPKSLEELQRQTGISMSELNELLLRLEFRHLAQEISQNCFIKLK